MKTHNLWASALSLILLTAGAVYGQDHRIDFNGKSLFMSGANIAWNDFAHDFGDPAMPTDTASFREIFREIHDNGGNSARIWIHINGLVSPVFEGNLVSGPGEGTITDLRNVCDIAHDNDIGLSLCLWSFDMAKTDALTGEVVDRNNYILTSDEGLAAYIDNALIPMVDSLEGHPGILAWEIFNEPEGMTEIGNWGNIRHVTEADIQRVVNRCAGAIHRADPSAKVTNGTWTYLAAVDVEGATNYYRDDRLIAAGGDGDGTLDFYTVHFYGWGTLSPFETPCSTWGLDKPLIIAEFYVNCTSCGPVYGNYRALYENGYAGAWAWSYKERKPGIMLELQRTYDDYGQDIAVADSLLPYLPSCIIESPWNGAEYKSGEDVIFSIYSKKNSGSVLKLEIFEGENKIGELIGDDLSGDSPYAFTWENPADGQYRTRVVSTDDLGNTKSSVSLDVLVGEPPIYKYEAEDAILTGGTSTRTDGEASAGKYVEMTTQDQGSAIEWLIPNCPKDSVYTIAIGYKVANGYKEQFLFVNDTLQQGNLVFDNENSTDWFEMERDVPLVEGENSIKIVSSWGWMQFDYLRMPFAKPPVVHVGSVEIISSNGESSIDKKGGALQLQAVVGPEDAADRTVSWSSSNVLVATVVNGWVFAKSDGLVTVTATSVDNPDVAGTFEVTITGQSAGLEKDAAEGIRVWPNPFSETFRIHSGHGVALLEVWSITGKKVLTERTGDKEVEVNLDELPDGIYFLHIHTLNGEKQVRKVIKR